MEGNLHEVRRAVTEVGKPNEDQELGKVLNDNCRPEVRPGHYDPRNSQGKKRQIVGNAARLPIPRRFGEDGAK